MAGATIGTGLGNVFVGVDFSGGAAVALERAAHLPLALGSSIDLLKVLDEEPGGLPVEQVEADAKARLDEVRRSLAQALEAAGDKDRDVFISVKRGKAFVELIKSARHGRAELLVVGRHGHRTFRDLLIGTTAGRVIRKGDVSVLVVARHAETSYRRPLVAVDMSDESRLALELARRMTDPAVEVVDVVHVLASPASMHVGEAPPPESGEPQADEERRARSLLGEFLAREVSGVRCNSVVRWGDPRQAILDVAKERNCDLLALGTKGRTGLAHVLLGIVAEGVLRAATCDVLVARSPRADFRLP